MQFQQNATSRCPEGAELLCPEISSAVKSVARLTARAAQQDAAADGRQPWLPCGARGRRPPGWWLTRRRPPVDTPWYTGGRS